jgi:hypothetical protein
VRFSVVSSNCGVTYQKVDQGQPVDSTNAGRRREGADMKSLIQPDMVLH